MITDPRERPAVPMRIVVEAAFETLVNLGYVSSGARLHIGPRINRGVSTQFVLRWEDFHGVTCSAYYKVLRPPRDRPVGWSEATRDSLNRALPMDQRLADLGDDEVVRAARVLAVDPKESVMVTLAIPGIPLTDHLRTVRHGNRRKALEKVFFGLGRFIRRVENCTLPDEVPPAGPGPAFLQQSLSQVRTILSDDLTFVERLIDRHTEEAAGAESLVLSHADLSPKNILVSGKDVGVIDFGWIPKFPGHDIGYLACRSDYVLQVPTPGVKRLVEALIVGYGKPNLPSSPQWALARVEALLRVIIQQRNQEGLRRMRYRRAVHELRREARRCSVG